MNLIGDIINADKLKLKLGLISQNEIDQDFINAKIEDMVKYVTFNILNTNNVPYERELCYPYLMENTQGRSIYFNLHGRINKEIRISCHNKPYADRYGMNIIVDKNTNQNDVYNKIESYIKINLK